MTNIDDIINGIDTLKPIPPVAAQIMALAEDENSSMSEIADLIVYDPSITASLLKICNSAYFGLSRKVESVRDAITLLGLDQIVELVLLNGTAENFITDSVRVSSGIMPYYRPMWLKFWLKTMGWPIKSI
jgi:HD-like signal output (HDOD) protein